MSELSFSATIKKSTGKGGWHYADIPSDTLLRLRKLAGKNGPLPVVLRAGAVTWHTTIMSRGDNQWFAAIKHDARIQLGVTAGDTLTIHIAPHRPPSPDK